MGQPVTRIVKALAAEGLEVAEGTVAGNLKALADLLEPIDPPRPRHRGPRGETTASPASRPAVLRSPPTARRNL